MWFKLILTALLLTSCSRAENEEEEEEEEEEEVDYSNQPTTPRPPPPIPLMKMSELVKMHGHEVEEFELKAPDGQKLALFHLKPRTSGGPVALLQHGLLMSPDVWCISNNSLAYKLTAGGVDVWLPSTRGNIYSRKHEKYSPDTDQEFWDFSFVEMAEMDFPIFVDFILEKTGQPSLYYLGHSMGTTIALLALSQKPEYNAKIKEAVLMAPIWHCTKYQFMVTKESSIYTMIADTLKGWDDQKKWEAFPRADATITDHQLKCNDLPEMGIPYCEMGMDMVYNHVGEYIPAGASIKVLKHMVQSFVNGHTTQFCKRTDAEPGKLLDKLFDCNYWCAKWCLPRGFPTYGKVEGQPQEFTRDEELKQYFGSSEYLARALSHLQIPYTQWDSDRSEAIQPDVEKLATALPNVGIKHSTEDENFNHPDFVMASSEELLPLTEIVHQKLLKIVKAEK